MRYAVPLSGVYVIDETKVRLINGQYYYVWIVRDVKTKGIPFFMVTSVRSGVYVLVCLLYTSPSPRDRQKSRMPSSA